jgi:membrane-associated protease RseP (regulator of RpoE activity)
VTPHVWLLVLASSFAWGYLHPVVHEGGHLITALATGSDVVEVRLWNGRVWFAATIAGVRLRLGSSIDGGYILKLPRTASRALGGDIATVAAGPGANFLCAVVLLLLVGRWGGDWDVFLWVGAAANAYICLANVLPSVGKGHSDGRTLAWLLADDPLVPDIRMAQIASRAAVEPTTAHDHHRVAAYAAAVRWSPAVEERLVRSLRPSALQALVTALSYAGLCASAPRIVAAARDPDEPPATGPR